MKIGLTYDLKNDYLAQGFSKEEAAEFDSEDTVAALERAIGTLGFETERIGNINSLVRRLALGDRWEMVFNIAEGLYGFGREAQVPALLEAYRIPVVFSDSLTLAVTLHKGMSKSLVRDHGLPTPDFAVIEEPADIDSVRLPWPLFAKPVAEGTGKGVSASSRINNTEQLRAACLKMLDRYRQPVLLETYLPGREFTVGIAGTGREAEILGVMEVIMLDGAEDAGYSYSNKANYQGRVEYRLADDEEARRAGEAALQAYRVLGCRDGGRVDMRSDAFGIPNFLEVNPLAGLHPVDSDLPILCRLNGIDYEELIGKIVRSALRRTGILSLPDEKNAAEVSCGGTVEG